MPKIIDVSKEIGKRYGRYTVLSKAPERGSRRQLKLVCQCDCGNIKNVRYDKLKIGFSKSCGCLQKEIVAHTMTEYHKKHGDTLKKSEHYYLYIMWMGIKSRCFNLNEKNYKNYGGRGITMYEPWINDYVAFKTWVLENLGERYTADTGRRKDNESIDRINVNEGYYPGNIRWADITTQNNNKRKKS